MDQYGEEDELICPIMLEVMTDPVMASDGFTYERSAIAEWMEKHVTSPMTNLLLKHKGLEPDTQLLARIDTYRSLYGQTRDDGL